MHYPKHLNFKKKLSFFSSMIIILTITFLQISFATSDENPEVPKQETPKETIPNKPNNEEPAKQPPKVKGEFLDFSKDGGQNIHQADEVSCWLPPAECKGTGTPFSSYQKFCFTTEQKVRKYKEQSNNSSAKLTPNTYANIEEFLNNEHVCEGIGAESSSGAASGNSGAGSSGGSGNSSSRKQCRVAGTVDQNVLALSWQPEFCRSKPEKPECKILDFSSDYAKQMSLHGLWPNRKSCGTDLQFCDPAHSTKHSDFCKFPDLNLPAVVKIDLQKVMPSVASGSCLERYEWFKHGTCQSATENDKLDSDQFFILAAQLTEEFNHSMSFKDVPAKLEASKEEAQSVEIDKTELEEKLLEEFGEHAVENIFFICKNRGKDSFLSEIRIDLPSKLSAGSRLKDLLKTKNSATSEFVRDVCPKKFLIYKAKASN